MSGLEAGRSGLKLEAGNSELEQLRRENQDLKRMLSSGNFNSSCQIPYEDLDVQDQVGGGGYSVVHRGMWRGTPVAIKKWFDPAQTEQLMQEFREEVMTLQSLRHPNVVQFLGACMRPPNLAMITEHLPFSLHAVLYQQQGIDLDRKRVLSLAMDMARGLAYLHAQRPPIVHRDIKPANFLVDRAWRVKLCDFGLASNSRSQAGAGTPAYMAPELLAGRPYNDRADIYAFGVVLNEMLARTQPFQGASAAEIKAQVTAGSRPDIPLSCPRPIEDLIKACWDQDPAKRPAADRLLDLLKDVAAKVA